MVFPVYDNLDPRQRTPYAYVTWLLIALNAAGTSALLLLPEPFSTALNYHFGMVPAFVSRDAALEGVEFIIPPEFTFLTYGVVHSSWLHLVANMLPLWVFGDDVEADLGHFRFFLFYLLCQFAGAGAHLLMHPASTTPLIGASGAVAGITAAYLLIKPTVRVVLVVFGLFTAAVRAYLVIGGWALLQLGYLLIHGESDVSFWCHAGGFLAGSVLGAIKHPPIVVSAFDTMRKYLHRRAARWRHSRGD
jgi:membrane associated rhomboid family serine protease